MTVELSRRGFLWTVGMGAGGAAVLGLAGCGGSSGGSDGGYEGEVAISHLTKYVGSAPFLIAEQLGYFEQEGLTLELVSFAGGGETVRGLTSGISFGMPATLPALIAFQRGQRDLRMISGAVNAALVNFVVPADSPVRGLDNLEGRTIGVSQPSSITTYFADRIVRENGLTPGENVELIHVGGASDAWTAAQQGIVDVAWSTPPLSDQLVGGGEARMLFETSESVRNWADATYWTTQEFIDDSPDVLRSWLRVMRRTFGTIQDDLDTAAPAYATRAELDEQVARTSLEAAAPSFTLELDMPAIEENVRAGADLGQLDANLDLNQVIVRDLVDGL